MNRRIDKTLGSLLFLDQRVSMFELPLFSLKNISLMLFKVGISQVYSQLEILSIPIQTTNVYIVIVPVGSAWYL